MGRQRVALAALAGRAAQHLLLEPVLALQVLDQRDQGVAAIAGAGEVADTDAVGIELLVARIAAQLQEPIARHRTADRDRAALHRRVDRRIHDLLLLPLAQRGVALGDVAELVTHRRSQLGLVVGQRDQPARHEHIARLQCMGIRLGLVEHVEAKAARHRGAAHQPLADPVNHGLELGEA